MNCVDLFAGCGGLTLGFQNAGINVVARSNIWVTEPVPVSDQPLYRNAVVQVHTKLEPKELLTLLHSIEADFGRVRHERNEARVLDLDLLSYNDVVIHEGMLKTLKRFKDEVKEVKEGMECGMAFENYDDIKTGDIIECFEVIEEQRELA